MNPPPNHSDLLPCPFCGGEAEVHHIFSKLFLLHNGCVVDIAKHYKTKDEAISAWNTRAPAAHLPDDVGEAVEHCKWMCEAYFEKNPKAVKMIETLIRHVAGESVKFGSGELK